MLRGQDLGTTLLARAETVAQERGCVGAWLTTQSFHAQGFDEKQGYEIFGRLEGSPRPHSRILLRKRFS
jgi:GNAT superfamily N-acetyltransferase